MTPMTTRTPESRFPRLFAMSTLLLLASLLGACSGSDAPGQAGMGQPPLPVVGVQEVVPQSLTISSDLAGRTVPYLIAEVRPQVSGIILERAFREGADVEAGALLYVIDPATYRAEYESAAAALTRDKAALETARLKAERYATLFRDKLISQELHDEAQAAFKQAQATVGVSRAALQRARINLDYTRVTAPIAGRIGRSAVTQGALVTANQQTALATVQQLDPIYVDVTQSSAELLRLKRVLGSGEFQRPEAISAEVELFLEDGSRYAHKGRLEFSEMTVDESTGSVTLRAVFPNPEKQLLPGMYVRTRVSEGVSENAILVPQQAVNRDHGGNASVLVLSDEDQVEVRPIRIARAVGNQWLVLGGLSAGDRVIVDGLQRVRPGVKARGVPVSAGKDVTEAGDPAIH